jgi:DNA-binding transcriptional LysR family regulator
LCAWTLTPVELWAVYPAGRMPSAKARAFTAWVAAILKAAPTPWPTPA